MECKLHFLPPFACSHEGHVSVVNKLVDGEALVELYAKNDIVMVPISSLGIGGFTILNQTSRYLTKATFQQLITHSVLERR